MTFIALVAQKQTLGAELDALRFPGAAGNGRLASLLVFNRPHSVSIALDEIDDCGKVQRFAREMDGSLVEGGPRAFRLRDAAVNALPFDGVTGVFPFALHPFQPSEARTVDELIEHPRGNQIGNRSDGSF